MARRENDYLIDRDMQKNVNYTGIQGIGRQDQAMIECMGEIVDRSLEHLAPSDRMIAITRKRLLEAAQDADERQARCRRPSTIPTSIAARAAARSSPRPSMDWLDAYAEKLQTAHEPARPAEQDGCRWRPSSRATRLPKTAVAQIRSGCRDGAVGRREEVCRGW